MEQYMAWPPSPEQQARYRITVEDGCLRAELRNRGTTEDVELFLMTVAAACKVLEHGRVLICLDSSNRVSALLQKPAFLTYLNALWSSPAHKVAVFGDRTDGASDRVHVESYPRQQGVNVRSFDDEAAALQWVRDRRWGLDRRREQRDPYPGDRRRQRRRMMETCGY